MEILEYCDRSDLIKREQHYIDILKPEYNILKLAGSSLGYKHDELALVKVRTHLKKLNLEKRVKVKVTNTITNVTVEYASVRETAKEFSTSKDTITRHIKNSKLFLPGGLDIYKLKGELAVSNDPNRLDHPSSIKIEVIDLELNIKTTYDSMLAATRALNINSTIISNYIKRNQISPYKKRYVFKIV